VDIVGNPKRLFDLVNPKWPKVKKTLGGNLIRERIPVVGDFHESANDPVNGELIEIKSASSL
jgi:hypothetical protein